MSEEVKNKSEYLVEVRDLKQYFPIKTGFMKTTPLKAVDGVSFSIKPGETLGLVGESFLTVQQAISRFSLVLPILFLVCLSFLFSYLAYIANLR